MSFRVQQCIRQSSGLDLSFAHPQSLAIPTSLTFQQHCLAPEHPSGCQCPTCCRNQMSCSDHCSPAKNSGSFAHCPILPSPLLLALAGGSLWGKVQKNIHLRGTNPMFRGICMSSTSYLRIRNLQSKTRYSTTSLKSPLLNMGQGNSINKQAPQQAKRIVHQPERQFVRIMSPIQQKWLLLVLP